MNLPQLLQEIEARLDAAMPAPWTKKPIDLHESGIGFEIVNYEDDLLLNNQTYYPSPPDEKSAELIASCPTDMRKLIEVVKCLNEACRFYATDCEVFEDGTRGGCGWEAKEALEQADRISRGE